MTQRIDPVLVEKAVEAYAGKGSRVWVSRYRMEAAIRCVMGTDEREWKSVGEGRAEAAEAKLAMAVEAFEAILGAEEECGRYSGPQRLAEVAIDRTVLFLRMYGLLSDEKLAELERRGSIGGETRQALSEIEQGDAK